MLIVIFITRIPVVRGTIHAIPHTPERVRGSDFVRAIRAGSPRIRTRKRGGRGNCLRALRVRSWALESAVPALLARVAVALVLALAAGVGVAVGAGGSRLARAELRARVVLALRA